MFTLDNFESVIDPTIISRGTSYYTAGAVMDLVDDGNRWDAVVEGSYDYEVFLTLDDRTVTAIDCDCPYDFGPYCKHMVALLYAVQAQLSKTERKTKTAKSRQSLGDVLEKLTQEQLIEIIMKQVKSDRALANELLLKYGEDAPSKDLYMRTIKEWMRSVSDHGFIGYRESNQLGDQVMGLAEQAETAYLDGHPEKAIPILLAVIETMDEALQGADDSNGMLSGAADMAFNVFEELVENASDHQKRQMFDTFLEQARSSSYKKTGLDYDWQFLDLAGGVVQTHAERETLFAIIDDKVKSLTGRLDRYRHEKAVFIKYDVMKAMGDPPDRLHQLLVDHVHLYRVRDALIDTYMADKNYEAVTRLALEGIVQSKEDSFSGLERRYNDVLMDVAKARGDIKAARKMAEDAFYNSHHRQTYYDELRKLVPEAEWPAYLEGIIERLKQDQSRTSRYMLRHIFVSEERWDDVMDLALHTQDFSLISQHRGVLYKRYPEKIADLYERKVYAMLQNTGRNIYKESVGFLRAIIKLDSKQRAFKIVDDLKNKYPKRRAMIEELDKL